MTRVIVSALILATAAQLLIAQEEPPEEVFNHSSRDLVFRVPPDFQLVRQNRRYLDSVAHVVPSFERSWHNGYDAGISVSVAVLPEVVWQQRTNKQIFDSSLAYFFSDPTFKLIARRSYQLDGCPAESVTFLFSAGTSRVDCFLAKPNMFVLAYLSSKPSSWDDPLSKAFFQSISLKPKP